MRDPRVVTGSTSKWIPKVLSRQLQCRTLFPSLLDGLVETLSLYIDSLEAHCVFSTQLFLAQGRRQSLFLSLSLASVSLCRNPASDPKRPCAVACRILTARAAEATSFSEGTSSVELIPASYPRRHKLPRPREFSQIVATCSCSHLAKPESSECRWQMSCPCRRVTTRHRWSVAVCIPFLSNSRRISGATPSLPMAFLIVKEAPMQNSHRKLWCPRAIQIRNRGR